jgi:hypothetical protein
MEYRIQNLSDLGAVQRRHQFLYVIHQSWLLRAFRLYHYAVQTAILSTWPALRKQE